MYISIILISLGYILNKDIKYNNKILRYECGEEEYKENNIYTIMYYKIAITYLVFDIETILLLPSALIIGSTYITMIIIYIFVIILIISLYIEYRNNIYI